MADSPEEHRVPASDAEGAAAADATAAPSESAAGGVSIGNYGNDGSGANGQPGSNAPASPSLRASGVLRVAAVGGALAAIAELVIAKGLEGIAPDEVVARVELIGATFAYFFGAVLWLLELWGSIEVLRTRRAAVVTRIALVSTSAVVVTLSLLAVRVALPAQASLVLAAAATVAVVAGAWNALREAHTRAVGVVMVAFALAAVARLAGWEVAMGSASDGGGFTPHAVTLSRGLATAGTVFEGVGQLAAAAWLGTRGKLWGQLLASLAVIGAFFIAYGAQRGATSGELWQVLLNRAFGDGGGTIPPYVHSSAGAFLSAAALLLALVAAVQPRQIVAVVAALSLLLLTRGNFDAPLRALAACAASLWISVAMGDDRAMWRALLDARARKGGATPPAPQPKSELTGRHEDGKDEDA